jgi:hypothetical protein
MMRRSRFCICLTLLFINTVSIAQEKVSPPGDPLLARADRLTDDLVKEAASLNPYPRAILLAGMGETWWNRDKERARMFFNKAVELAKAQTGSESAGRSYPFATAHAVFSVLARYDEAASDELMKMFLSHHEKLSEQDRNQNARAIAGFATNFINTDPQRAFALALKSIQIGTGYHILSLVWGFSARDSKAAELLFKEALAAARSRNNPAMLDILAQTAYQYIANPTKKQMVSDRLCAEMLNLIADSLLQIPASRPLKREDCLTASDAARLLDQIDRLLPARAAAVREAVSRCQSFFPPVHRKEAESYLKDQPLKTAEDYLKAAESSEDESLRVSLRMRAASLAAVEKDYERAINILDRMHVTPGSAGIDSWNHNRRTYAARLAVEHTTSDRIDQAREVIISTPDHLQASVYIEVASEMAGANAVEFIKEARRMMPRAGLSSQTLREYLTLVSLYGERIPAEAMDVLNEAVEAINRAWHAKPNEIRAAEYEVNWLIGGVPLSLLEADEAGVKAAISSVEDPVRRVSLLHSLLRRAVLSYRPAMKRVNARQQ